MGTRRAVILVALLAAAAARGADPPLTLSLSQRGMRTGAPLGLEAELNWRGPGLLEGRLELAFHREDRLLALVRTQELVLQPGAQKFALTVPAMMVERPERTIGVRARFSGRGGDHADLALGALTLAAPGEGERALLVCISDPWQGLGGTRAQLFAQSVRFEEFNPVRPDPSVTTRFLRPEPVELPASAIEYLRFDLVLLIHEGFAALAAPQLAALADWVEGGGSALVAPPGILKPHQVEFLDRLARAAGATEGFAADGAGRLERTPPAGEKGLVTLRPGIGRAVAALEPLEPDDFASAAWRRALLFLWKARRKQADAAIQYGAWRVDLEALLPNHAVWQESEPPEPTAAGLRPLRMGAARLRVEEGLIAALMPSKVRIIPVASLALVLIFFIIAVGPGDYLLLGALRRRRWTWALFPLVSAAFTLFVVSWSRERLGDSLERRSLAIVDCGADGAPQREDCFELVFTAAPERLVHPAGGRLFSSLESEREGESAPAPAVEGRFPADYDHILPVEQWKPQLYRSFSFEPGERRLKPHWERLEPHPHLVGVCKGSIEAREVADLLLGGQSLAGRLLIFHGVRLYEWSPGEGRFIETELPQREAQYRTRRGMKPLEILLPLISSHPQAGLFSIVSQVSPGGGARLEDLSLHDPTDPREWLVVLEQRDGNEVVVYRKLYREAQ